MKTLERLLPTEDADIREIVATMLTIQARFADQQHAPGVDGPGLCGEIFLFAFVGPDDVNDNRAHLSF